jgi:hypothetical protein
MEKDIAFLFEEVAKANYNITEAMSRKAKAQKALVQCILDEKQYDLLQVNQAALTRFCRPFQG